MKKFAEFAASVCSVIVSLCLSTVVLGATIYLINQHVQCIDLFHTWCVIH